MVNNAFLRWGHSLCWRFTNIYILVIYVNMYSGLGKWVEVGNSGVFRPEMLLPMGLPENLSVIAWGLSLERYGVHLR